MARKSRDRSDRRELNSSFSSCTLEAEPLVIFPPGVPGLEREMKRKSSPSLFLPSLSHPNLPPDPWASLFLPTRRRLGPPHFSPSPSSSSLALLLFLSETLTKKKKKNPCCPQLTRSPLFFLQRRRRRKKNIAKKWPTLLSRPRPPGQTS